jgi:hypothetical protein
MNLEYIYKAHGTKMFGKKNYKVFLNMRFILHQNIVPKIFLFYALLNTRHLLES